MFLLLRRKIVVIPVCLALTALMPLVARALEPAHKKPMFESEYSPPQPPQEEGSRDEVPATPAVKEHVPPAPEQPIEPPQAMVAPQPEPQQTSPAPEKKQDEEILGLGDVLRRAYLGNPTLLAARQELKATHELLPQATAGWKPTASANAGVTMTEVEGSFFGGDDADGSTAKDVGLELDQPLYRGGRTLAQTSAARHTIAARQTALSALEQDILREAAAAYMDVMRDQALLDLSENNRTVIARQLEATRDRFSVGELTRTDISQAEARLARAEADSITARGNLRRSQAIFEQVTGMPPGRLAEPSVMISGIPETLDEAEALAEASNLHVLAAMHTHSAAEEDVDGVFGELLPQVGLFSRWNRSYDPSPGLVDKETNQSIGISASIPLYEAGAVRSRVRQAKLTANQRYIQILEARREARKQAVSDWESLQAARAEITSRTAQVEASGVAQEGVKIETEVGQRTILEALDADQELLDAQAALISAKRNEIVAGFSLAATLGLLTPQTLGFQEDVIDVSENLEKVSGMILDMDVDRVGAPD